MSDLRAFFLTVVVAVMLVGLDAVFHRESATLALAMYATFQAFRAQRDEESA